MNANTLVSVHGYAGDAEQIKNLLPYYRHHQCPVVIMSPVDSQIGAMHLRTNLGQVQFSYAGQRQYIGPLSLERQKQQMKRLLKFPHKYFLMNDSDSVCISGRIPDYLYQEDIFWSNEVSDLMHELPNWPYPRLAFQPPYFCSRGILERMVAATDHVVFETCKPLEFIDHYMMRLAHQGGIPHKNFNGGCSCPTAGYPPGQECIRGAVLNGAVMLHAIKTPDVIANVVSARIEYNRRPR